MRVVAVDAARRAILAAVATQPPLRMPLLDAAGHVLAEDVLAAIPLPPWTNAAMDGYAARADDVRGARPATPVRLRVVDRIAAGSLAVRALAAGEAARIYTGAPVPDGADSVIRQEDTDCDGKVVIVRRDRDAGANVRRAGGDLARGALALAAGTVLGPRHVALLAALAVTHPLVHRRPRVGVLTSGDEVVSADHADDVLASRKLADAIGPALLALVAGTGGVGVSLGIATDDPGDLQRRVAEAGDVDLLITAGGASVGDHDHVRAAMTALGVDPVFDRVRVRPGGPTIFGQLPGRCPWLALPGNPVSALVTFELFGRPAIRAMAGYRQPGPVTMRVVLRDGVTPDTVLDQYLRVALTDRAADGTVVATLTGGQGSGLLMPLVRADALAIVPAGPAPLPPGAPVEAIRLT